MILSGCLQIFIHSIHLFLSIQFAHISTWDQTNAISNVYVKFHPGVRIRPGLSFIPATCNVPLMIKKRKNICSQIELQL